MTYALLCTNQMLYRYPASHPEHGEALQNGVWYRADLRDLPKLHEWRIITPDEINFMKTEPVSETPPPSPAGYGPAFKGDEKKHDDKRHWQCWNEETKSWNPTWRLNPACSSLWYCKPLTEKAQVKGEPEWPRGKSVYTGEIWKAFRPGEDAVFKTSFVSRAPNNKGITCVNSQEDLEENAKLLGVFLQWQPIPASHAAELTGDKSLERGEPDIVPGEGYVLVKPKEMVTAEGCDVTYDGKTWHPWKTNSEFECQFILIHNLAIRAIRKPITPLPVARDTGEDACKCGHKIINHSWNGTCNIAGCECTSFRKRGEQKCDIHTVAPVSGASIKPTVSSPAPGETTKPVSEGAQVSTLETLITEHVQDKSSLAFKVGKLLGKYLVESWCHGRPNDRGLSVIALEAQKELDTLFTTQPPTWHSLDDYPLKDGEKFHLLVPDSNNRISTYPQGWVGLRKDHYGQGYLIHPAVPPYAIPEPPGKGEKPQTEKVIFDFLSGLEMTGTTLPDDVVKWWKEQAAIKKG